MEPTLRRAARVLLVDEADRVLLFRGFDPARPETRFWFTPGGGLNPAETFPEAAAREVAEETGLLLAPERFGPPVWENVTEFGFDGVRYRQDQQFFLVRMPGFQIRTDGFNEIEHGIIDTYRWWGLAELDSADEPVYPLELSALLRRLLDVEAAKAC